MKINTTAAFGLILLGSLQEQNAVESFSTTRTAAAVVTDAIGAGRAFRDRQRTLDSLPMAKPARRLFSTVGEEHQQQQQQQQQQQTRGGPPASATEGRPSGGPPGTGGPPGGPPGGGGGGPPGGGPPPQTRAQKLLEVGLDFAFEVLYFGDDIGLQDSSKNLRVLWTRAILNKLEKIDDPIAFELLPKKSRWVANLAANFLPQSVVEKLDWIVKRTDFIDGQLSSFLEDDSPEGTRKQVVVLGSGYDTRCLRYGGISDLDFYCVDLPVVASNCGRIVDRYVADARGSSNNKGEGLPKAPTFVPLDLNDVGSTSACGKGKSLLGALSNRGFVGDGSVPTMVLCEAVLFYLSPPAARAVTTEVFSIPGARYCLTDNLSKVGVLPGGGPGGPPEVLARSRCASWLEENRKDLVDHDSIW
eukprot:CAMPEP_0201117616 /NCGR_PEP_ID=MMETSP0850-20130426/1602_1 /ASSEMBLY_ACC=CAM_ASM_000622 /TAXON_ID=183588 /ORGANISM="Pseudo-nitzschia fraudulenta, Strain WWA7" /LENGTH=415 /DNA_ID=CAMNT_0047382081 /DNA_START=122 /DNA_END=1366 /DNA_ORIENTATION=+